MIKRKTFESLRNRKAIGDTDEATAGGLALTMGIAALICIAFIGLYAIFHDGTKTVVDTNTKSIQQQNESITKR